MLVHINFTPYHFHSIPHSQNSEVWPNSDINMWWIIMKIRNNIKIFRESSGATACDCSSGIKRWCIDPTWLFHKINLLVRGACNGTYFPALRQPKFNLLWQPLAAGVRELRLPKSRRVLESTREGVRVVSGCLILWHPTLYTGCWSRRLLWRLRLPR